MEGHQLARSSIAAATAALCLASVCAASAAERDPDPASVERMVLRAERVDRALGRHAALPLPDQNETAGAAMVVPRFPPRWLYGQPYSQQPFFANRPLTTQSTGK